MRSFQSPFGGDFLHDYQAGTLRYLYKGVLCVKSPIDTAIYMKAIWDVQPQTIIEIGSKAGGSALLLADIMTSYGIKANIVSIDICPPSNVSDERIRFLPGDVNNLQDTFVKHDLFDLPRPWLITEDSAHTYQGCLAALTFFAEHMCSGEVIAMEDGILNELGLSEKYDGGPNRAISEYIAKTPGIFEINTDLCDMFGTNATYNPNGYLQKI